MRRALFILLLAAWVPVPAQSVGPHLYGGLSWRFVGLFRGGRTLAATGISGNPFTYYMGAVDGGVFKTTDCGHTWRPLFQHERVSSVGALAVAPSNPRILYVGTGECAIRNDITYGGGVFRSDDGGESWRSVGLVDTKQIAAILISPSAPEVVLVAALGHAYGPNPDRGVYRTTDGGRTWTRTLFVNVWTGAVDLARDPGNPDRVYAVTWNAHRAPWEQYAPVEGPGSGLYRSEDGGRTWRRLAMTGLPENGLGRMGLAVAPGMPGPRVFAVVSAGAQGGVYRSDDGGETWRRTCGDARFLDRGWYFGQVSVDPKNPDVVYVPHTALYRSSDGGAHFTAIKGSPGGDDFHALWISPEDPGRMIVAADQGASITVDGGTHWSSWYNQPTAQVYRVAADDAVPYRIYGNQQDSGPFAIESRSYEGRITYRSWETTGGDEGGYVLPRPGSPKIVYSSGPGGRLSRYDAASHQSADISPSPLGSWGTKPWEAAYNFPWNTALALSPFDADTLYAGAQVVFRSRDRGNSWEVISPTLTGRRPDAACAGDPTPETAAACGYDCIHALAPSPLDRGVLWAGTTAGRIWVTTDGGTGWKEVTPPGLPPWSNISTIEPSPFEVTTAYAAVDRHTMDDLSPRVLVTHDGGASWRASSAGIPEGAFVRVVRADRVRRGLLYAGTETGVYVSFEDGSQWQPLQQNLPTVAVHDLCLHGDDLIAATHGRGIWVLDDVEPLREASSELAGEAAHLFTPAPALRLRPALYRGEPVPPEEPHAQNPPTGAILDYYLAGAPRGPLKLSITDASGRVVRSFSSDTVLPTISEPPYPDEWKAPASVPGAREGHSRFVWDLRWAPPEEPDPHWGWSTLLGGAAAGPEGPLVVPGTYTVMLDVDGHRLTAPLTVLPDPSVRADAQVLEGQVALALRLRDAAGRALRLQERLAPAQGASQARGAHEGGDDRLAKLGEIRGGLLGIMWAVQEADVAPSATLLSAVETLMRQLEEMEADREK